MKGTLGTLAAVVLATLAVAPAASAQQAGEPVQEGEQTRESYAKRVEPICAANRRTNSRIMAGARQRLGRKQFLVVGRQFVRLSRSIAGLARKLGRVAPPPDDARRIARWLHFVRLLSRRTLVTGQHYKRGQDIKAAHASILAERAGISANNVTVVMPFKQCRFNRIG